MHIEGNPIQTYHSPATDNNKRRGEDRLLLVFARLAEGIVKTGVFVIAGLLRLIFLVLKQIVRPR